MSNTNIENFYKKLELTTVKFLNVVLEGESGVGKECFARMIHEKRGHQGDFIIFDWECGHSSQHSILEYLAQNHLIPLTNADPGKRNTYFFRRIDLLSSQMQLKILELLESKAKRGGLSRSQLHQLGLIASSEKKHKNERAQNDPSRNYFLELFPLRIAIPPLRDRKQELGTLMHKILESVNRQLNRRVSGFSFETYYFFIDYCWPNNIHELRSEIERAVALTQDDDLIKPEVLSGRLVKSQKLLSINSFIA